ncbi:MAG: LptE family protein [Phycisphaeraceae bacterium]|nr:LptE family protein [Phycisphaeraceae bacterium]
MQTRIRQIAPSKAAWPRRAAALLLPLACVLVAVTTGCGYKAQTTFPTNIKTIAIPIFENRSFYRGVEFDLTEALIKEIELRTPYKVVSPQMAETVLEGSIMQVGQSATSRADQTGLPEELEVRLTIDFRWTNVRTGETIRSRQGLTTVGRYIPSRVVGQPFTVAQHQAAAEMADRIIATMREDW